MFYKESSGDSIQFKNNENNIKYRYGILGVMFILPSPFIEGGIQLEPVVIRGNISYNLAYLDARVEIAFLREFNNKNIDFFFNGGINSIIQVGGGYSYGLGIDISPLSKLNKQKFYKIELGFFKPWDSSHSQILPRIGIGWRFDYLSAK